jgi:glycosyltransferase involved in cell wall biosynthesis
MPATMKILSLTAGAAGMYCGSCLRDNSLATELLARGHDVTLMPLYTPTRVDERNVSADRVLFGGISVYLQQHLPLARKLPRVIDRIWDSASVIRTFAKRSLSVDARLLGDLTISMLQGQRGVLAKEFDKLLDWLAGQPLPDVVDISNSLLIALARPIRQALGCPVCCTLQGEDLFLSELVEPYRHQAIQLIREEASQVDRFIAVSDFYRPVMSRLLEVPLDRISVVPLGINLKGYSAAEHRSSDERTRPFTVGYFARVAPEKGLEVLARAYELFRRRTAPAPARLEAAGYLSHAHREYLDGVRRALDEAGVGAEFAYRGEVDRTGKLAYLRTLDVLSVPATYDEPKGVFLLEAMASGVPVVQPERGAFTEIVQRTGGGLLVPPDDPSALADALVRLWKDRALGRKLGEAGADGVRAHYSISAAVDHLLDVYQDVLAADRRISAAG